MKIIKWLLLGLFSVVLLLTLYLTFWFDLNDIKQQLINKVAAQTGRTLQIQQDIGWSLYPDLALELKEISLSQPEGLPGPAMLKVAEAQAAVALWPLLDKQIQLKKLKLHQVDIFITEQGKLNSWSGLTQNPDNPTAASTEKSAEKSAENPMLQQLQLDELELSQVQLSLQQNGKKPQQFSLQQFSMQQFQPGKAAPVSFHLTVPDQLDLKAEAMLLWQPQSKTLQLDKFQLKGDVAAATLQLQSTLQLDNNSQQLQWQLNELKIADSKGSGSVSLNYAGKVPAVQAELSLDQWQLQNAEQAADAKSNNSATQQPDLSFFSQFAMQLKLQIKQLQLAKLELHNSQLQLQNQQGLLSLKQASAELYQGNINASGFLDARQPLAAYQLDAKLAGLDMLALLKAAADMELLSGTAALQLKAQGQGLLPDDVKTALVATGDFQVTDGAINGINIPAQIRSARAALKNEAAPDAGEAKKTDFSSLTGSFTLSKAVLENHDLQLAAPLLRLSGTGNANLSTEQLDYQLKTALVNTLKGQGGKSKDELANIEIPLRISGTFAKPKYQLDTKALFEQHLKQKVDTQKDKLKNKLLEKLGGG